MNTELIEELRDTFKYHPDGYLIRKKNGKPCGQHANTRDGYAQVKAGGKKLYAHRIIYAIVHGETPAGEIDHIDGDRMNNRIENLRDVPKLENQHNRKNHKDNSSGFPGVRWHNQAQKWQVQICVNYRVIYLGLFDDIKDAVQARRIAKIKYHPSAPEALQLARE